jgi:hypothetical protein
MLSTGKLANGQEGYYLDAVARGVEDYYLEGEAPGRWLGAGTALLGLEGEVDSVALAAVLDGRAPTSGTPLRSSQGGRVPGFDLTFRAPKSVSVVFGIADADVAAVVAESHDALTSTGHDIGPADLLWTKYDGVNDYWQTHFPNEPTATWFTRFFDWVRPRSEPPLLPATGRPT